MVLLSYDQYESFAFLSYVLKKEHFEKNLGFYLHFEKKSNLALKSGWPYAGMHIFWEKNHKTW